MTTTRTQIHPGQDKPSTSTKNATTTGATKPTRRKTVPKNATTEPEQTIKHKKKAPTHTKVNAMTGKTIEELRKELKKIDFSAIAGDKLILWVQEIESDAGTTQLPMFEIQVPPNLRVSGSTHPAGVHTKNTIVSLIEETLTQPLSNGVPEDIFAFYQLLAVLALTEDGDAIFRSTLIDSFEKKSDIGILPLLRAGKYLPHATSIRPWKEHGKKQSGVHELVWTN